MLSDWVTTRRRPPNHGGGIDHPAPGGAATIPEPRAPNQRHPTTTQSGAYRPNRGLGMPQTSWVRRKMPSSWMRSLFFEGFENPVSERPQSSTSSLVIDSIVRSPKAGPRREVSRWNPGLRLPSRRQPDDRFDPSRRRRPHDRKGDQPQLLGPKGACLFAASRGRASCGWSPKRSPAARWRRDQCDRPQDGSFSRPAARRVEACFSPHVSALCPRSATPAPRQPMAPLSIITIESPRPVVERGRGLRLGARVWRA